jgi:hypothetical protein
MLSKNSKVPITSYKVLALLLDMASSPDLDNSNKADLS